MRILLKEYPECILDICGRTRKHLNFVFGYDAATVDPVDERTTPIRSILSYFAYKT